MKNSQFPKTSDTDELSAVLLHGKEKSRVQLINVARDKNQRVVDRYVFQYWPRPKQASAPVINDMELGGMAS